MSQVGQGGGAVHGDVEGVQRLGACGADDLQSLRSVAEAVGELVEAVPAEVDPQCSCAAVAPGRVKGLALDPDGLRGDACFFDVVHGGGSGPAQRAVRLPAPGQGGCRCRVGRIAVRQFDAVDIERVAAGGVDGLDTLLVASCPVLEWQAVIYDFGGGVIAI